MKLYCGPVGPIGCLLADISGNPRICSCIRSPPLEPVSVAADLRISNSKKLVEAQNSFVDNSFIASASFREA